MSDHNAPDHNAGPDPMDKAYAQAEAVLDDEAVRAARRARVLAAISSDSAAPAVAMPSTRRAAWAPGGWLVAASVAGLSVLVAIQFGQPEPVQPRPAATSAAPAAPDIATSPAPAGRLPAQTTKLGPLPPSAAPRGEVSSPRDVPPVVASAPAPPPPIARATEAPSAARSMGVEELVVSGAPRESAPAAPARMEARARASQPDQGARLRDAAAAGRIAEMNALLARDAPVDAADDDGDTALMKAVRANHPAAAALLRRYGASLDLKNRAGSSARDMAASIGDAELNRALDLGR